MDAIERLRGEELERMFADWGRPTVLRRVTQTPAAATGVVAEAAEDFVVMAIVRGLTRTATRGTASQHGTQEREFLVRTGELPPAWSWSKSRIVHDGQEFAVAGTEVSSDGMVVTVRARRL